jgi:hypothetical protein
MILAWRVFKVCGGGFLLGNNIIYTDKEATD